LNAVYAEIPGERSGESRIGEAPSDNTCAIVMPAMPTLWFNAVPGVKVVHSV
jgi:hypothetical protein